MTGSSASTRRLSTSRRRSRWRPQTTTSKPQPQPQPQPSPSPSPDVQGGAQAHELGRRRLHPAKGRQEGACAVLLRPHPPPLDAAPGGQARAHRVLPREGSHHLRPQAARRHVRAAPAAAADATHRGGDALRDGRRGARRLPAAAAQHVARQAALLHQPAGPPHRQPRRPPRKERQQVEGGCREGCCLEGASRGSQVGASHPPKSQVGARACQRAHVQGERRRAARVEPRRHADRADAQVGRLRAAAPAARMPNRRPLTSHADHRPLHVLQGGARREEQALRLCTAPAQPSG